MQPREPGSGKPRPLHPGDPTRPSTRIWSVGLPGAPSEWKGAGQGTGCGRQSVLSAVIPGFPGHEEVLSHDEAPVEPAPASLRPSSPGF